MTSLASVFVEVRPDTSKFSTELKSSLARTREAVDVAAKLDTSQLKPQLAALKADLNALTLTKANITADSAAATAKIRALRSELSGLNAQVRVDGDTGELKAKIAAVKAELASISDAKVNLKVDSGLASAHIKALQAQLAVLGANDTNVRVNVDQTGIAGINALTAAALALGPALAPLAAVAVGGVVAMGPALLAGGAAAGVAGLAFHGVGDALTALTEHHAKAAVEATQHAAQERAAAASVANAQAALTGARRAAAQGAASAAQAIADAQRGVTQAERESVISSAAAAAAVKDAQTAVVRAVRDGALAVQAAGVAVRDAQEGVNRAEHEGALAAAAASAAVVAARRSVVDATEQAAAAVASALRNQQQAEDTLERAQRSQREAQVALTEARVVAERKLQDYALQVRQASLDERDAALTLADAKKRLDFVNADPTASNAARERARVAYEEQVLQVKELETHNKRLRADAEDAARKGVSGSDEVVAARQREKDAAQQVADAQQGLRDAQAAIAKAHRDGARQVQDAERRVAEAVAARTETELSSQQRIGDARARVAAALRSQTQAEVSSQERIGDARKRVAAALQSQSQTEAANQRRIGDAQRSVGRARQNAAEQAVNSAAAVANAQRGLRTALAGQADATDKVSASQQSLNEKMAALSPAGRQLVRTLAGLGPVFSRLQGDAQGGFFAGLTRGIGAALPAVPVLRRAVRGISDALGDVAAGFGQVVGGPAGRGFIAFVGRIAPPLIRQFGRIVGNLGSAFTDLMVAFAPVTNMIMRGLVRLSAKFADFAAGGGFQPLVDFMMQQGPGIVAIIGTIARAVGRLVVAAIPIGTVILRGLGGLAGVINRIPVPVLTGLVAVVGTLVAGIYGLNVALRIGTAVQNAAAVASKVWAAGQWLVNAALSANPIGLVVVAIAGLVAGFVIAYKKSETFRNIVNGALNGVKDAAVAVKNWFTRSFVPFFTDTIPNAFHATVNWVKRNWPVILAILTGPIGLATLFISRHWDTITNAFRAGRDWVMGAFRRSWDRVQAVFTSPVQAAVRVFRNLFGAGGTVRTLFRDAISAIGGIWGRLGGVMSGPVNWVIRNVINRLVDAVNWVSRKLNKGNILQHFGRVGGGGGGGGIASNPGRGALNPGFARGGVLPGYTPGKDVHTFHSATGGTLHLSGGEAVMRPEWTRAVGGAPAVQRMNDAARRGMRFAGGGVVWPTVGRRISTYRGHDGVDINQPPGPNFGAPIYAYRAGRITYTGWGRGYGDAVFEKGDVGPEVVYGHMSRVVARAKQRVRAGQTIGYVGETGNARGPHLHFGVPGGTYAGALALLRGATNVRGGSSGALGALQDLFDPLAAIIRRLRGIGRGAVPGGQIGRDLVGAVKDKVTDLATGWARGLVGTVGSAAGAVIGGNGAKAYAQKALASYGWGMAQWPALNALWEQESGWNPRADNPTSSAYGIPQALPGSKMATAGRDWRTNPATQIRWGLGYIRDRYGSPTGAMAHERARGWYDNGGVARGRGVMLKNTELPERVLSPQQTDTYDRLLPILERLERGNTGGSGPVRIILDAGGGVTLTGHIDNRIQGRAAQAATVGRQRR